MESKSRVFHTFLIALLISAFTQLLPAQSRSDSKIAVLHFQTTRGTLHLVGTTVRPGFLKPVKHSMRPGQIGYEVKTLSGVTTVEGAIDDPTHRRFEYEDPAEHGRMRSTVVVQDSVDFNVRIPYLESAATIGLFRVESAAAGATKSLRRIPIQQFDLHMQEGR